MDVCDVRHLQGRPADFCLSRYGSRVFLLGRDCQQAAAAGFFRNLENIKKIVGYFSIASEKNLPKYENFICILEKMGYNKVE